VLENSAGPCFVHEPQGAVAGKILIADIDTCPVVLLLDLCTEVIPPIHSNRNDIACRIDSSWVVRLVSSDTIQFGIRDPDSIPVVFLLELSLPSIVAARFLGSTPPFFFRTGSFPPPSEAALLGRKLVFQWTALFSHHRLNSVY